MPEIASSHPMFTRYPYNLLLAVFMGDAHAAAHSCPDSLDGILEGMPDKIRKYVLLYYQERMSYHRIAQAEGTSVALARYTVMRGLDILRSGANPDRLRAIPAASVLDKDLAYMKLSEEHEALKAEYARLKGELDPDPPESPLLSVPISVLGLSSRPYNALVRAKIGTLGQLVMKTDRDIRKLRAIGEDSYKEIVGRLAACGLSLQPDPLPRRRYERKNQK